MTALRIIGGAFSAALAALLTLLAVSAIQTGIDYKKEGDAGAELVCFVTGGIVFALAVLFGALTVVYFGG